MIGDRNPLTCYLPEIRARIAALAQSCAWPELEQQIARHLTLTQLPPHLILPVASAAAVGGKPADALPVAAACGYLVLATRWFDDVEDRDRPQSLWCDLGPGRAVNMAAAALTLAWRALAEDERMPGVARTAFGRHTVALARGQDLDLRGGVACTLEDYWQLMRGKTGTALMLACEVGALAACPERPGAAVACGRFGSHLGVVIQILDDLDGTFHPDGSGDLRAGKATLPVLYGLSVDHGGREELAELVHGGRLASDHTRVLAILESIDTREFLVWCAFDERKQAMACLDELPTPETETMRAGRDALTAFADSLVLGWEDLLKRPHVAAQFRTARDRFPAHSS